MLLKHLDKKPPSNTGSFKGVVYLTPVSWIATEGKPVDTSGWVESVDYTIEADEAARDTTYPTPTGNESCYLQSRGFFQRYDSTAGAWNRVSPVLINEDHTFNGTDGFIRLEATKDKMGKEIESPEELDVTGKIFRPQFALPGWTIENMEFERLTNQYTKWIVLYKDGDGNTYQYGTVDDGCTIRVQDMPVGENATNFKGIVFQTEYHASNFYHYHGLITLKS